MKQVTIDKSGWLSVARRCVSPNCDSRPLKENIRLLVIHNISLPPAHFGGPYIEQFFCNRLRDTTHAYFSEIKHLKVSAHLLIDRLGQLTQFVSFDKRAWHAGKSNYLGQEKCNDFSIGIELEGTDTIPYTDEQYKVLAIVTNTILSRYPMINEQDIVGHADIAPGRKTDPGSVFDWHYYRSLLEKS